MRRLFFFINMLLFIVIYVTGSRLYSLVTEPLEIPVSVLQTNDQRMKTVSSRFNRKVVRSPAMYQDILRKNLFHPDRSLSKPIEAVRVPLYPPLLPHLTGIVITDETAKAYLSDAATNETKTYKIHDMISGYKIIDIQRNKVILTYKGDKTEIRMIDKETVKAPKETTYQRKDFPEFRFKTRRYGLSGNERMQSR